MKELMDEKPAGYLHTIMQTVRDKEQLSLSALKCIVEVKVSWNNLREILHRESRNGLQEGQGCKDACKKLQELLWSTIEKKDYVENGLLPPPVTIQQEQKQGNEL